MSKVSLVVLKILTTIVCSLFFFSAFSSANPPTDEQIVARPLSRSKRDFSIASVALNIGQIALKALLAKIANGYLGDTSGKGNIKNFREDLMAIVQELSVIRRDLSNLRTLFQDQAMKSDYVNAEKDIRAAVWSLKAFQEVPTPNLREDFLEAAKPIQSHVKFLLDGLLGRHTLADDILTTLVKVEFCRTRKLNETVGELVTLIKAGIFVEDWEKEMRNYTWSERKPFLGYLTNATEELDKVLAAKFEKCRQLKDVNPQIRRILDDHADDEDPKKVLHAVFEYLSDRYDQHHWFVLTYNAQKKDKEGLNYDSAFYEASTSIGKKHKVAALPVARQLTHTMAGNGLNNQARHFLIDSMCPGNHSYYPSTSRISYGFYFAYIVDDSKVRWTHSPGMDVAKWPYHNGSCHLGKDGEYYYLIAPPYKIPTDHIPSNNRGMALINTRREDVGVLTASSPDSSSLSFAPYAGQPGQRWQFVGNQLQNDLGMCATLTTHSCRTRYTGRSLGTETRCSYSYEQHPCALVGKYVWHVNIQQAMFPTCGLDEWDNNIMTCFIGYYWYFSEDGKLPFHETRQSPPLLSSSKDTPPTKTSTEAGRPLVHASSGLVLTVQDNDPTSSMLILDVDRGWAGQRWRFEGRRLINDWNLCFMRDRYNKLTNYYPCQHWEVLYAARWHFQDGYIKSGRDNCLSGEYPTVGSEITLRGCSDSAALEWNMEDHTGPLPPRPVPVRPAISGALVNGFGLALTAKDDVIKWSFWSGGWWGSWLIQETYRGRSGQRWFLHENRLHNDLGNCLYSDSHISPAGWILQNDCYKEIYTEDLFRLLSSFWYRTKSNQLKNYYGCLGAHKNANTERAWLVVEQCDANKLGQIWTFQF